MENGSYNPHWIGKTLCRDYLIGNIVLKDVPDDFVLKCTNFRSPYGFAVGNVEEFTNECKLTIPFSHMIKCYRSKIT